MPWAFCLLFLFPASDNDNFRGFLGGGQVNVNPAEIPMSWSSTENLAWKFDIEGYGQSSPVVYDGQVYLTSTVGDMKEEFVITCLQLADGKAIWKHRIKNSQQAKNNVYVSRAAPTPVVDDKGVYCFFESGDLIALNHDGKVLWERSFAKENGLFQNRFGLAASPVQTPEHLIVLADDKGPSFIAALRKSDGKTEWQKKRASRTSWSSPMMFEVNGKPVVVVSSNGSVDGYSPKDGTLLFEFDDVGGNTVATPLPNDTIENGFVVAASPGRTNEYAEQAKVSNAAFKIVETNGDFDLKRLWIVEATPSFGSPILYRGYAYWVNSSGVVTCFDASTGKEAYKTRLGDSIWATPVGLGDHVYFFGKTGLTVVVKTGPKFEKVAENRLWDKPANPRNFENQTLYGVALVGKSLLIRSGPALYCVRKSGRP